jgi:hypothetical protein
MSTVEFVPFPKIPRLKRGCVITEKLDGTNAQVAIDELGNIRAGSRTRWISRESDNFGFASWVDNNRDELLRLGPGRHFGEWYGSGIQRGYGLTEKRFALFNTSRWTKDTLPACCSVVPILYVGEFDVRRVNEAVALLRMGGSVAVPGFMKPEGAVVFHAAASTLFKVTCEKDESPKGEEAQP